MVVVVAYRVLVSTSDHLGLIWVLIWVGLGFFGMKGLGPGLDNRHRHKIQVDSERKDKE